MAIVVASLLVVLAGSEVVATQVMREAPGDWGVDRISAKVAQIESLGDADVVLLGDSTVEVGFDPDVVMAANPALGIVYNAALPAASPELWRLWSDDVVEPALTPDTVVIGFTSLAFNDFGTFRPEVTDRYRESPARETFSPVDPRRWSALVRHRNELRRPGAWLGVGGVDPALSTLGHDRATASRGYSIPESFATRMRDQVLVDYAIAGTQVGHLHELVGALRTAGIDVVLVDMPVVIDDHLPLHDGGEVAYAQYRAAVERLESELGVRVLAPPESMFGRELFADPVHLNQEGTRALSEWLATMLPTS